MKLCNLILKLLIIFPTITMANDYKVQCHELINILKAKNNANLVWGDYSTSKLMAIEKIQMNGFEVPIIVTENVEYSAFYDSNSSGLTIMERDEDDDEGGFKSQILFFNSLLSQSAEKKFPPPFPDTVFEIIKESLSVTPDDVNCNITTPEEMNTLIKQSVMISTKSLYARSNKASAIRINGRNAFIITNNFGFEYFEMRYGKTLMMVVDTYEASDLDQFINSLNSQNTLSEPPIVNQAILEGINSNKVADWENVLKIMEVNNYSESSTNNIIELISKLTEQNKK
ncbi:hypothetical protein [Pseudoalteromonas sp. KAN5]|uniref:hypothetical protein n=1 Tax=Pseudoalteromonas sp. KAN5 TaxID=2916633 RepID=UPI001FCB0356|nr:hypothetical protein [Pseudoalteromonas sp. KAN5]BDF95847.1 hypothetical protein KAN5_26850 [Pseudoalteromonas sp. KAN5]